MRFRPDQHLRSSAQIRAVRERGSRVDCGAFTLWWRQRDEAAREHPRAAVIASTAAVGNAVSRNRAKRRLRELFRAHQDLLPAGCDFLLIARGAANHRPFAELDKRFVEACRAVGSSRSHA